MIFCIELAEIIIEIHSLYNKIYDYCNDFIISNTKPDIIISLTDKDIQEEKELVTKNNILERKSTETHYSNAMLEVFAVHRLIANEIIRFNCFVMHGSVVAFDNKDMEDNAIIFSAKSGVGKTTHTSLWLDNNSEAYILNGDKPIIRVADQGIYVYGTPWQGKERLGCNKKALLKAICFIERNEDNHISKVPFDQIYLKLIMQCHRPPTILDMNSTLNLVEKINCDFYYFYCNNFKIDSYNTSSIIKLSLV